MSLTLIPILEKHQVLSAVQVHLCHKKRAEYCTEIETILALELMTSEQLAESLSKIFSVSLAHLSDFDYQTVCQKLNKRELIISHQALPLEITNQALTLAITDPTNHWVIEDFRFATNFRIKPVIVDHDSISAAIRRLHGNVEKQAFQDTHIAEPVTQYIHNTLLDAVQKRASDIHFEPYENNYRVRYRLDGILIESQPPEFQISDRLSARLKVLSQLDISEKRLPQDGRMKVKLSDSLSVDLRVSTLPTLWGEKIVLRILDRRTVNLDINELGFTPEQANTYRYALNQPQGLILITGPTGSGKSISLYTGLQLINSPEKIYRLQKTR